MNAEEYLHNAIDVSDRFHLFLTKIASKPAKYTYCIVKIFFLIHAFSAFVNMDTVQDENKHGIIWQYMRVAGT